MQKPENASCDYGTHALLFPVTQWQFGAHLLIAAELRPNLL